MKKVTMIAGALALTAGSLFSSLAQAADTAICYNCPPEWADWGTQLNAIAKDTGIQVPQDNKNSGQALRSWWRSRVIRWQMWCITASVLASRRIAPVSSAAISPRIGTKSQPE